MNLRNRVGDDEALRMIEYVMRYDESFIDNGKPVETNIRQKNVLKYTDINSNDSNNERSAVDYSIDVNENISRKLTGDISVEDKDDANRMAANYSARNSSAVNANKPEGIEVSDMTSMENIKSRPIECREKHADRVQNSTSLQPAKKKEEDVHQKSKILQVKGCVNQGHLVNNSIEVAALRAIEEILTVDDLTTPVVVIDEVQHSKKGNAFPSLGDALNARKKSPFSPPAMLKSSESTTPTISRRSID